MRINPISHTISPLMSIKNTKQSQSSSVSVPVNTPVVSVNEVSFGRSAKNGEPLRRLFSYRVPDIYSEAILLDPDFFQEILQLKIFSHPLKTIVRILKPVEDSLINVEANIFSLIQKEAQVNPKGMLDDFMHSLVPDAKKDVEKVQLPIFEELIHQSKEMPLNHQKAFETLLETTLKRINENPISLPFDSKDFRYKMEKIEREIKNRGVPEEIEVMEKLTKQARYLMQVHNIKKPKSVSAKREKLSAETTRQILSKIRQMENYKENSVLANDAELTDLFTDAKSKLMEIPIVIPFKRKNFIHDLETITLTLKDQKLAHQLLQTAIMLPTSKTMTSAFILNTARSTSEKIGYTLLNGSVGTLDHIIPYNTKQEDNMYNYLLASSFMNSERGHRSMPNQISKYPQIAEYGQAQIDRLIDLYHDGVFRSVGLDRFYIENVAKKLNKLSPKDSPITLDLSRLK